jgi:hypothetical protein
MKGRSIPLSRARRIVSDHSYFARKTPQGVLRQIINIEPMVEARAAAKPRPSWTSLFIKAFALVAQGSPPLRQAYVKLPWPQLYEYPVSVASLVVERSFEDEDVIFTRRIKDPANRPLTEIAATIEEAKTAPIETITDFKKALQLGRAPTLIRRAFWWLGMNIGRQRPNYFGTFGISVLGATGTTIVYPVSSWSVFVSYGPIAADGSVEIVLAFDHRVMDGAVVARAFGALEATLNGPVAAEVAAGG